MNIVEKALVFAFNAHQGQVRKYTNEPYINHPIAVAKILQDHDYSDDVIAAALLHDTVEDTLVTINDIKAEFGDNIRDLVYQVTDISTPEDGNRAARKAIDRQHIINGSFTGKSIKLADLVHNTGSIIQYDKNFAKIYLMEKALILDSIGDVDVKLYNMARETLNDALWQLDKHKLESK